MEIACSSRAFLSPLALRFCGSGSGSGSGGDGRSTKERKGKGKGVWRVTRSCETTSKYPHMHGQGGRAPKLYARTASGIAFVFLQKKEKTRVM